MNKEQFLAMSLPYGIKAKNRNEKGHIHNVDHYMYQYICDSEKDKDLYKYDLILRPLSDLTKEIEHKGEKFVPMVELAKIAEVYTNEPYEVITYKNGNPCVSFKYIGWEKNFIFDIKSNCFSCVNFLFDQLNLFQIMVEWHFDICGLIEKGEAIDVNTLTENPYK